ncbi:MAG: sugar transferase [Elusimicrobiota bacterium]|nr:sugar transferase [Elusimicrobiota bacterium]
MPASAYARGGKRAFDFVAALAGLLILAPVLAGVALAIAVLDPGPVFFRQTRVGLGFKPFRLFKFRTMRAAGGGPEITAGGDPRVTPLGRLLRKTKLDELPQLLNVLAGDMSLVGPRPEVPKYVELFREDYALVLSVRPGITDYAAIEYRDEEAILKTFADPEKGYIDKVLPEKIKIYRRYLAGMSFATDVKIIAATLWRIGGS